MTASGMGLERHSGHPGIMEGAAPLRSRTDPCNKVASGLNLVVAAIVYWNSTYMADAVVHLRSSGAAVPDSLLTHTSPVGWEHIGFSGDFLWDRAAVPLKARRPLNRAGERLAA